MRDQIEANEMNTEELEAEIERLNDHIAHLEGEVSELQRVLEGE